MRIFWSLIFLGGVAATLSAAPVDFAREVLPILSNKCFVCHGPDGEEKKVLRLDSFQEATRDLGWIHGHRPKATERK